MGGFDGENHAAFSNSKHAMMGWVMNEVIFLRACITRQMWVFQDCANFGVHNFDSSSHYRRPHIHPLLYLTASVHTWCLTRDVHKPGKTDIFEPKSEIFKQNIWNIWRRKNQIYLNKKIRYIWEKKSEIFVSDLSSPGCIGCQSIFEPGGAGSPVLCSRMVLEQGLSVPMIIHVVKNC